ncbi:unnamed protein product [Thlaspi arvense]|uniref:Uncharacterized protein n=1 Tax=Thlaspi arvense TaxID=13288 RepID=A0AAU9RTV6_THLAR|nr:unnamed protein product [Thlaspi arvense]
MAMFDLIYSQSKKKLNRKNMRNEAEVNCIKVITFQASNMIMKDVVASTLLSTGLFATTFTS